MVLVTALGVAWALLHATSTDPESVPGVNLVFRSDVPVGAGLSSSAALECAVAVALDDLGKAGSEFDTYQYRSTDLSFVSCSLIHSVPTEISTPLCWTTFLTYIGTSPAEWIGPAS